MPTRQEKSGKDEAQQSISSEPSIKNNRDVESLFLRQEQLFDAIEKSELSPEQNVEVLSRLFEHAPKDALKLATRLRVPPGEITACINRSEFFLKHPLLVTDIEASLEKFRAELSGSVVRNLSDNEAIQAVNCQIDIEVAHSNLTSGVKEFDKIMQAREYPKFLEDRRAGKERTDDPQIVPIIDAMDQLYSEFMRTRKFKESGDGLKKDNRSRGEQMAESFLEQVAEAGKHKFFSGGIKYIVFDYLRRDDPDALWAEVQADFADSKILQERYESPDDLYALMIKRKPSNLNFKIEDAYRDCDAVYNYLIKRGLKTEAEEMQYCSLVSFETVQAIREKLGMAHESWDRDFAKAEYKMLDTVHHLEDRNARQRLVAEINESFADRHISEIKQEMKREKMGKISLDSLSQKSWSSQIGGPYRFYCSSKGFFVYAFNRLSSNVAGEDVSFAGTVTRDEENKKVTIKLFDASTGPDTQIKVPPTIIQDVRAQLDGDIHDDLFRLVGVTKTKEIMKDFDDYFGFRKDPADGKYYAVGRKGDDVVAYSYDIQVDQKAASITADHPRVIFNSEKDEYEVAGMKDRKSVKHSFDGREIGSLPHIDESDGVVWINGVCYSMVDSQHSFSFENSQILNPRLPDCDLLGTHNGKLVARPILKKDGSLNEGNYFLDEDFKEYNISPDDVLPFVWYNDQGEKKVAYDWIISVGDVKIPGKQYELVVEYKNDSNRFFRVMEIQDSYFKLFFTDQNGERVTRDFIEPDEQVNSVDIKDGKLLICLGVKDQNSAHYNAKILEFEMPESVEDKEKRRKKEFDTRIAQWAEEQMEHGPGGERQRNERAAYFMFGNDSEKAWQWREKKFSEGRDSYMIAGSLAGLDSERAWKMRGILMEDILMGSRQMLHSLSFIDSPKAQQIKERIYGEAEAVGDGGEKTAVIRSLSGCDSDSAWKIREKYFEYAKRSKFFPDELSSSLDGFESGRKHQMGGELFRYMLKCGFTSGHFYAAELQSIPFLSVGDEQSWNSLKVFVDNISGHKDARFVSEIRELIFRKFHLGMHDRRNLMLMRRSDMFTPDQLSQIENIYDQVDAAVESKSNSVSPETLRKLNLLNLVHKPKLRAIEKYFSEESPHKDEHNRSWQEKLKKAVAGSKDFALTMGRVVADSPRALLNTMAAKRETNFERQAVAAQLTRALFPEAQALIDKGNQKKESTSWWGRFKGKESGGVGQTGSLISDANETQINGGDPRGEKKEAVLEARESIEGFVSSGIYGKYNKLSRQWGKVFFSNDFIPTPPTRVNTATISEKQIIPGQALTLPLPSQARILPERVKAVTAKGQEIELSTQINSMGEANIVPTKDIKTITYSFEQSRVPEHLGELTENAYQKFVSGFKRRFGSEMSGSIMELPSELKLFVESIGGLSPKEKVVAIEQFVINIGYYDFDNKAVMSKKDGAGLEELLSVCEDRLDDIRRQKPEMAEALKGKKYAGVCADFAKITIALLREAGIVSGFMSGFQANGKTITSQNAHGVAFVVWPDELGRNKIFSVDTTPGGVTATEEKILEIMRGRSIAEKDKQFVEQKNEVVEEAEQEIAKILSTLISAEPEAIRELDNGKLEEALNIILRYEVKNDHLQVLKRLFDAYWYSPAKDADLNNESIRQFLTTEIEKQRNESGEQDPASDRNAGSYLFEMIEEFAEKFVKGQKSANRQDAFAVLQTIADANKSNLNDTERRAVSVIIKYLQAKKMVT